MRRVVVAVTAAACVAAATGATIDLTTSRPDAWATAPPPPGVRLSPGLAFNTMADPRTRQVTYTFPLANSSASPVDILRIGQDGSGLKLVAVTPTTPFALGSGQNREVTLTYQILDCAGTRTPNWSLPVQTRLAQRTGTVAVPLQSDGRTDPWQSFLARPICQAS